MIRKTTGSRLWMKLLTGSGDRSPGNTVRSASNSGVRNMETGLPMRFWKG